MNYFKKFVKKIPLIVKLYRLYSKSEWEISKKILARKTKLYIKDNKSLKQLHLQINNLNKLQLKNWTELVYCDGAFYQGYMRIGLFGIKPTEERLKHYQISSLVSNESTILDIGSNAGFISLEMAKISRQVTGIEYNPYLIKIGQKVADYLKINNVQFINCDFKNFRGHSSSYLNCDFKKCNLKNIDFANIININV